MTAPEDRVVLRDVFPAEVAIDGAPTYRSARVIVTRYRVYVYVADGRTPLLVLDEPYTAGQSIVPRYNAPRRQVVVARLDDGRPLTTARQRGCGCSSPLAAWHPWHPYRIAA